MSAIFLPAVSVANRMSFSAKLFSVVLIFLVPYLFLLVMEVINSEQQVARLERQQIGLSLVMELKPMAMDVAKHRGNMAQYLSGATDREAAILSLESKVDDQLAKLGTLAKSNHYESDFIARLASSWQQLKIANTKAMVMPKNFQSHSDLVIQIQQAIGLVADDFELIIQLDANNHYLENIVVFSMPQLIEELGKLRGSGSAALTDKAVTPNERIALGTLLSAAERYNGTVNQDLELLFKDPVTQGALKTASLNARDALSEFFQMTNNQVLLADEVSVTGTAYFEAGTRAIEAITAFDAQMSKVFEKNITTLHYKQRKRDLLLVVVAAMATALGIYLAAGILTALSQSARALNDAAGKLRNGDFSLSVMVNSEDTLGDAAKSLTGMVGSVATLLHTIQSSAHDVNELSVKLQTAADSSKQELDSQNLQTQQSASAATEMAATVREVARSCVYVTEATETARVSAIEGRMKVNEAIGKINALGNDVERAKEIISHLQSDVTDIGAVLEVIRSIAEQTNLLALNAAIEAARAGEQGRGFAVVADEVRSLAKRTQDSTAEIRAVIETLQSRAETAVNIIHQSYSGAQDSVTTAAGAGQALERIVSGVEQLRDLNTQIATAAEQQAAVAEQMSRNTQQLCDSAENILDQVQKTVTYGANLRKGAMVLLENAMKFKT